MARQALVRHYQQAISDQPTADDRERRQSMSRRVRKK
jgi:hypothetical protein